MQRQLTSGAVFTRIPTGIDCNYNADAGSDLCCASSRDLLSHAKEKQPCGSLLLSYKFKGRMGADHATFNMRAVNDDKYPDVSCRCEVQHLSRL